MPDIPNEGNPAGQEGSATPSIPQAQPLPGDLDALKSEILNIFEQKLADATAKWQSDKDRRIPKVENEVGDMKKQIEQILAFGKGGLGPDQIEREMLIEQVLSDYRSKLQPQTPSTANAAGLEASTVISRFGLDPNDPLVFAAAKAAHDQLELAVKLAEIKTQKALQPNPNPAQAPAAIGKPPSPLNRDALAQEYTKAMLGARGNKALCEKIQTEYKQKGLDIEHIAF